jgi:outer membrane protein assembly factor BamA
MTGTTGGSLWSRLGLGITVLALLWSLGGLPAWSQDGEVIVASVKVEGARRYPEARILNEIKTRAGQPFRTDVLRDDVRRLDATQRYVVVKAEQYQAADGIAVVLRVVERATVQDVVYDGAKHLSREDLETLSGIRRGSPMSVALNKRAVQAIEKKYHQELGRLMASVELVEGDKEEDTRVVFRITEGPVVRLRDIRFEGNTFVGDARLKTQIESSERWLGFGGKYVPPMLEQDLSKLGEYYKSFGYFDAKIRYEKRWNPGYDSIDIVIVIDEGVRYLIKDIEVAGNGKLDREVLLAKNKLEKGQPFSGQVMQASLRHIQDEYGRRGYVTARVNPDLKFSEEPGNVTVVYQVSEGPPAKVGEIIIVGNTVTRENVIRRQLQVFPGQLLSSPDLRMSERNLARLNIFKVAPDQGIAPTVQVLDPDSDSEFKDVLVQVEEDRTGSLLVGMGINSDAGATASIVLNERNFDIFNFPTSWDDIWSNRAFRGAGQEFRAEVVPGTQLNRFVVSFREPYLFDTPNSLGLSGYYYTRIFNEYDERRTGGRITGGRRLTNKWTANVSFRAENVQVSDFPFWAPPIYQEARGNNTVLAPKLGMTRDTRDSILRATEGNFLEIGLEYGLGSFNFPVFTVEDSQYFTLYQRPDGSGRHVLALRGMVGIAGDDTPLFERFYAGGFRTLRGFEFRGVGPEQLGFKTGGTFQMLGSVEYQIPILANDNVYAVVFSDFGTVEEDIEIKDVRVSVGGGLRLIVPMFGPVPIALDWAYPVVKKDTDDRQLFSFWVGFFR